jgi:hypothetical protein
MPKQVQHRRGSTAQHSTFTGAIGEITVDTDKKVAVIHDGSTPGGFPHLLEAQGLKKSINLAELTDKSVARSNLSVFSKMEAHSINKTRKLANAAYFDGLITTQRIYAPLGSYTVGLNPFSLRFVLRVPASNTAVRTIALISSANNAISANGFAVLLSSGSLQIRKYGATTSDYIYQDYSTFVSDFAQNVVELTLIRSLTNLTVYLNGMPLTLGAPAVAGAGAAWLDTIASNYLIVGAGIGNSYLGEFYGVTLFNYPLSPSATDALVCECVPASDIWADDNEMILATVNRTFASANDWANISMTGYDELGDLSLNANATGLKASLGAGFLTPPAAGRRYQIACDVNNLTGTTFHFNGRGAIADDLTPVPAGTIAANGHFYSTFLLDTGTFFGDLQITSDGPGSVDLDNISLKPAGAILDWDFDGAVQYQVPDKSTNAFHGLAINNPIFLFPPRRGQIRGRTNTNGNQQLLDALCLPPNARIAAMTVNNDGSGTPTNTVNIGTSSGGSQIAFAASAPFGRSDILSFATRYTTSGSIWINANGTSNLDWTILFDLVD